MEFLRETEFEKMMLDKLSQAVREYVEAVYKPLNSRHRKTIMVFTGDSYKPVDIITRFEPDNRKTKTAKISNSNDHKISIPLPEDAKWEAIGRGYASVLMEKQARIDRLERLIWMLHENICKDVRSCVLDENDMETQLAVKILRKYKNIKSKLLE